MKHRNKTLRVWNAIVMLLVIGFLLYLGYQTYGKKVDFSNLFKKNDDIKEIIKNKDKDNKPEPKLKIIDLDSKTRSIAVMVDNETGATPQAGLQDAYIVYEIIIEGGETRFLALYKDKPETTVGPNRSARHYFLDYALENNAIYTHFGFSPQAQRDIKTLGINDISGTEKDGSIFWREKPLSGWHNVFTTTKNIMTRAIQKGYKVTSDKKPLLNYSISELDLSKNTDAKVANAITIYYSNAHYVKYEYDSVNKVYKRFERGKVHSDKITGLQLTIKNIIIYNVRNYALNDEPGKGRQGLDNLGNGVGYYISDGYAIPITWQKTSREAQTIYRTSNGSELLVNDGNTFIHLQPLNKTLTIQ